MWISTSTIFSPGRCTLIVRCVQCTDEGVLSDIPKNASSVVTFCLCRRVYLQLMWPCGSTIHLPWLFVSLEIPDDIMNIASILRSPYRLRESQIQLICGIRFLFGCQLNRRNSHQCPIDEKMASPVTSSYEINLIILRRSVAFYSLSIRIQLSFHTSTSPGLIYQRGDTY